MRTILLAVAAAALAGPGIAQESGRAISVGEFPMVSALGDASAENALPMTDRVYTLPPEVDVETTGSIAQRGCVGETTGQRMCPDTTTE